MQKLLIFLLFMVISGAPAAAQGARAITHEDLWLTKRVGTPAASPDGKWVVFSREQTNGGPVCPDENHWILKGENSRFFYSELHAWWAKWLR